MAEINSSSKRTKTNKLISTKKLVIMALMVALNIILARFLSFMVGNSIRISLEYIPLIIAGTLTGPIGGALTGVASDLLGFFIRAHGAYFPGFTISYMLIGCISGLILHNLKGDSVLKKLLLTIAIIEIFISLILNTFWLKILIGKAFLALLPGRLLTRAIVTPIEFFFLYSLFKYETFRERL